MRKLNTMLTPLIMVFITHAMPPNLLVDEVVRIGQGTLSAVSDTQLESRMDVEGGAHG